MFAETLRNYITFCVMSVFVLLEQQNFTFAVFVQKCTIANPATLAGTEVCSALASRCHNTGSIFREKDSQCRQR